MPTTFLWTSVSGRELGAGVAVIDAAW